MDKWMPTPDEINALPLGVKNYIYDLSTLCDPAGIIAENILLRDEIRMIKINLNRKEKTHEI